MRQKTEADRVEVIGNLLTMALALADRIDPILAATIAHAVHRVTELEVGTSVKNPELLKRLDGFSPIATVPDRSVTI